MKKAPGGGECCAAREPAAGWGAGCGEWGVSELQSRPVPAAQASGRVTGGGEGHRSGAPTGAAGARPREGGARGSRKSCRFPGKLEATAEAEAAARGGL